MKSAGVKIFFSVTSFHSLLAVSCQSAQTKTHSIIRYTVRGDTVATINPELFGQFMERPSWAGESGPESALASDGKLVRSDVTALIHEVAPEPPVTIGQKGDRVTNHFGYDEYFAL